MIKLNFETKIYLGIGLFVLFVWLLLRVKDKYTKITIDNLDRLFFQLTGGDVATVLERTTATNYSGAETDAKKIQSATKDFWSSDCWGSWNPNDCNDDEEAIYSVLYGKSAGQIKAIDNAFIRLYGQNIDEHLKEYLDTKEYEKCLNIIKAAK